MPTPTRHPLDERTRVRLRDAQKAESYAVASAGKPYVFGANGHAADDFSSLMVADGLLGSFGSSPPMHDPRPWLIPGSLRLLASRWWWAR